MNYDYYDESTGISACIPNKPMRRMLTKSNPYSIIGIHNHPKSHIPSIEDLNNSIVRKYKYGLIICHNGTIFKYIANKGFYIFQTYYYLEILADMLYNINEVKIAQTLDKLKDAGLELEVLR